MAIVSEPKRRDAGYLVTHASGDGRGSHGRSDIVDQFDHTRTDLRTETLLLYRVADAGATEAERTSGSRVDEREHDGGNVRSPCADGGAEAMRRDLLQRTVYPRFDLGPW